MVKHGNKSCFWIFKLQLHAAGYSDTDYPVISYLLELERMSRSKRSEHSLKFSGWGGRTVGWPHLDVEKKFEDERSEWSECYQKMRSGQRNKGRGLTWCIGVHLVTLSSETWLCSLIRLFTRRGTRLVVVLRPPGAHQNLPPSTHQSSIISGITTITILSQKSF